MTSELENAIINDYLNKLKITEIIKKYHVSSATVSALLKKIILHQDIRRKKELTLINVFFQNLCVLSRQNRLL